MPAYEGRQRLPRPLASENAAGPQAFLELTQRLAKADQGGTAEERDAFYGVPTTSDERRTLQGARWFRTDTGNFETYYDLYNIDRNPGGASSAGWLSDRDIREIALPGLQGTMPPAGAPLIRYVGRIDVSTNENGDTSYVFPSPFPNGTLHAALAPQLFNGLGLSFVMLHSTQSRDKLNWRTYDTSFQPIRDATIRYVLDVTGW